MKKKELNELNNIKKDFGKLHHKENLPDWFSDGDEDEIEFNFGATIQKT